MSNNDQKGLLRASVLANPRCARRSQECGSSAALPSWRLLRASATHMEKCCGQRDLAPTRGFHDAPQDEVPWRVSAARRAHKFPESDAALVLTARDRAAYIGGSRCAVRLGVTARLRSGLASWLAGAIASCTAIFIPTLPIGDMRELNRQCRSAPAATIFAVDRQFTASDPPARGRCRVSASKPGSISRARPGVPAAAFRESELLLLGQSRMVNHPRCPPYFKGTLGIGLPGPSHG